ncbi:hypothetical protein [Flammeovirga sp. SJP92]|uniref:hypothetical protein n=1 Tax=Flammeovirga sp. SJP92 TaxID=1775430 RepID=UPI00078697B1|nr:hypothetical protein [Flammeovirga sp. SJP92]KXX72728.1 hypothetical protein AVL50_32020 [Flammeovirga sp. SJP92]
MDNLSFDNESYRNIQSLLFTYLNSKYDSKNEFYEAGNTEDALLYELMMKKFNKQSFTSKNIKLKMHEFIAINNFMTANNIEIQSV